MAEKVLHEWIEDGRTHQLVERETRKGYHNLRIIEGGYTTLLHAVMPDAAAREILRLSADLARARAEGRLEGVQKATDEIVMRMPCPGIDPERDETKRVVMGVLNRHIAAAERELAGGEEEA